jgi:hypothetical protein
MRATGVALLLTLCVASLNADTCLAPKNAVPVRVVCGHVVDPSGGLVANVELQIVSKESVIAEIHTDARANFMFGPIPAGEYDLTTKTDGWYLFWPVKVTSSKPVEACRQPLEVKLGIKTCGASVSKKGYHAKFGN